MAPTLSWMKFNWDFSLSLKLEDISNSILLILISPAFFLRFWIFLEISLAKPSASNSGVIFVSSLISSSLLDFVSMVLMLSCCRIISWSSLFGFVGEEMVAFARGHFSPTCSLSLSLSPASIISEVSWNCFSISLPMSFEFGFGKFVRWIDSSFWFRVCQIFSVVNGIIGARSLRSPILILFRVVWVSFARSLIILM